MTFLLNIRKHSLLFTFLWEAKTRKAGSCTKICMVIATSIAYFVSGGWHPMESLGLAFGLNWSSCWACRPRLKSKAGCCFWSFCCPCCQRPAFFLEESTGMSATFICITLLVVSVGSCFYTAKRLDGMQQRIFRLALATEASYFEVLQASEERSQPLISVSSILGSTSNGSLQDLPQNDLDLTTNFTGARSSMSRFQHSVCDPLSSLGSEVVAKIKPPAEADERGGDVDILFCEVVCDSLQRVQDGWHMLKEMHDVQIVTARDFFAIASSRKMLPGEKCTKDTWWLVFTSYWVSCLLVSLWHARIQEMPPLGASHFNRYQANQ